MYRTVTKTIVPAASRAVATVFASSLPASDAYVLRARFWTRKKAAVPTPKATPMSTFPPTTGSRTPPPANAWLQLHWHDVHAGQRRVPTRTVDISKFGVLVEVERSIPTGTIVAVYTTQGVVVGRGSVRHCTPKGLNYFVGLYLPNRMARAFREF